MVTQLYMEHSFSRSVIEELRIFTQSYRLNVMRQVIMDKFAIMPKNEHISPEEAELRKELTSQLTQINKELRELIQQSK